MAEVSPLTADYLRLTLRATEPLELEQQSGSALRGVFFRGLWDRFCVNKAAPACADCPLVQTCPVSTLVAPLREEHPRGRDVPRPFVIRPPSIASAQGLRLEPGQQIQYGLILLGSVSKLFPYVVMAAETMEQNGLGRALQANGRRRGRFRMEQIEAVHPFTGAAATLYTRGETHVRVPALSITAADVATRAENLPADQVILHFLTPTRLTAGGHLASRPDFLVLALRLAERLEQLEFAYAGRQAEQMEQMERPGEARYQQIKQLAASCEMLDDQTHWVDTKSYSSRQQRLTPIGGFVGQATFSLVRSAMLWELLVWGEVLHVGKNTVKGDGWYQIESSGRS